MDLLNTIYIGFDPRETKEFAVACHSIRRFLSPSPPVHVRGLVLSELVKAGLYRRPTSVRTGPKGNPVLFDDISGAPMSTEHANARFFVPYLAGHGWNLFTDSDVLFRRNVRDMVRGLDTSKAVYCVKHDYTPKQTTKMDGQIQTSYERKNWSSVVLFNADHPSNKSLTPDVINLLSGKDLHRFCWLKDNEIGALDPRWNVLIGESEEKDPYIAHFTNGTPVMDGYENVPFADEWRQEFTLWASNPLKY